MTEIWERWGALTRSVISIRVATERERSFWEGLSFTNRSQLKIKAATRDGRFTLRLVDHVDALEDEHTLLAASLVLSYALAESAALDEIEKDSRNMAGIEDWGERLLNKAGNGWSDVVGGRAGAVEVGVVRNQLVHGRNIIDEKNHARLSASGCLRFQVNDPIALDFEQLALYRARLRSLLVAGGLGTV